MARIIPSHFHSRPLQLILFLFIAEFMQIRLVDAYLSPCVDAQSDERLKFIAASCVNELDVEIAWERTVHTEEGQCETLFPFTAGATADQPGQASADCDPAQNKGWQKLITIIRSNKY